MYSQKEKTNIFELPLLFNIISLLWCDRRIYVRGLDRWFDVHSSQIE